MKIYTKFGDTGETALYGGTRIPKDALQIEAIGTVDELNAYIGYACTMIDDADISDLMVRIQNHLFALGADLATPKTHTKSNDIRISSDFTSEMETAIDTLSDELPPLTNFILPGGCPAASVYMLREPCVAGVNVCRPTDTRNRCKPRIIRSLNRLSDLLFILARVVNHRSQVPEPIWKS